MISKKEMCNYATALDMWQRKFDTAEIAAEINVAEPIVLRWIHSFREMILTQRALSAL